LFNASFGDGIFPPTLIKSVVTPIYKRKIKEDTANYRPVALVPTFPKVLENVIVWPLIIFPNKQHI
jgi:hypothetical protein